jgi:DNA repair protein RadC
MVIKNRDTGIGVLGSLPWGSHICILHDTEQSLVNAFLPYIKAGLKNNEFCLWITSNLAGIQKAGEIIRMETPDFLGTSRKKQIEIEHYKNKYFNDQLFDLQIFHQTMTEKLKEATNNGYDGLRVVFDMSWVRKHEWEKFIEYAAMFQKVKCKVPMLGFFAYPFNKCSLSEYVNLMNAHIYSLIIESGKITQIGGSKYKQSLGMIDKIKQSLGVIDKIQKRYRLGIPNLQEDLREFKMISDKASYGITIVDSKGYNIYANDAYTRMHGYTLEEVISKHLSIFHTKRQMVKVNKLIEQLKQEDSYIAELSWHRKKDGTRFLTLMNGTMIRDEKGTPLFMAAIAVEITHQRQAGNDWRNIIKPAMKSPLTPLMRRFAVSGLKGFSDSEIIELFLSVCPHRRQKYPLPQIIRKFKNIRGLLAASPDELKQVGLNDWCIDYIKLLREIPVKVLEEKIEEQLVFTSPQDIYDYLEYSMRDLKKEVFKVIYLDSRNQIIKMSDLFTGTLDKITVDTREVAEFAVTNNAKSLIFVHNHPSGDPSPSRADKRLTQDLVFVGDILQIRVLDHIIIGDNRYFSFTQEGLIQEYETDFLNLRMTGTSEVRRK